MSWHKMQSPRAVLMLKHQSMVPSLHALNPSVEVDWNRTCASGKWFFGILCRLALLQVATVCLMGLIRQIDHD